jgi:leader peptidase (prepilin peptidase) / N-methyltransferase
MPTPQNGELGFMFPEWTWIVGLMIGATIGSFLNVVIYRMPRNMSLGKPKNSFCPNCKVQLSMSDLVPLFSWLSTKGKCRYCYKKVPARYFWVELINGLLWAGLWYRYFCYEPTGKDWVMGCFYGVATAALVAIIFIDGEHFIIPDEINAFLLFLGIAFHLINGTMRECLIGYLVGWGIIFGIAFLGRVGMGKDAMGHGDIKMMRGVGALIGPLLTVIDVGIAVVTGLIFGLIFIALSARKSPPEVATVNEATGTTKNAEGVLGVGEGATLADATAETASLVARQEEEDYQPEPIKDLLILGFSYLLCFDVVAIWFPKLYEKMGYPVEDISVDEDDWQPSMTTIPFGPYLAIGALVCMLFRPELLQLAEGYVKSVTGTGYVGN